MKTSVRWVYQRLPDGSGAQRPAICFSGKKFMLCVASGPPVRVLKRPLAEAERYRPVHKTNDGTVGDEFLASEVAGELLSTGGRTGITDDAERLLRAVVQRPAPDWGRFDESQFNDEESSVEQFEQAETVAAETTTNDDGNGNGNEETDMQTQTTSKETRVKGSTVAKGAKKKAKAPATVKAKVAKTATKAKVAKAPKEKRVGKRAQALAYMRKRIEGVKAETAKDPEWGADLVKAAQKETGVSEISLRSILRKARKMR
jgi:hypothetical protein